MSNVVRSAPSEAIRSMLANDCSHIAELADALCTMEERHRHDREMQVLAKEILWKRVYKPMSEKGQLTKTIGEFVFHCKPPRVKWYCAKHMTLLHTCPDGPSCYDGAEGIVAQADSVPDCWVSRKRDE